MDDRPDSPKTVTVELPQEFADLILRLADAIRGAADPEKQEEQVSAPPVPTPYEEEIAERKARLRIVGIQAFRDWRKQAPKGSERAYLLRALALKYSTSFDQFNAQSINWLIQRRRREVKQYLAKRRAHKIVALYRLGHTYGQISDILGLPTVTIGKTVRQHDDELYNISRIIQRNRLVLRELSRPKKPTNRAIARKVSLHEKTVARIIRDIRRETGSLRIARAASLSTIRGRT